ncbi:MAG: hypothetical protein HYZ45_10085 [Burkholderiales bacterium]|nr:hypothetical protein [Burkholderiales bacterium]
MNMASPILLVTEIFPVAGKIDQVAKAWAGLSLPTVSSARAIYRALDDSSCIELLALEDMSQIALLDSFWQQSWSAVGADLAGDFQRQLLRFVEAPKNCDTPLPNTPFIQMRHVEVKPVVYQDYLAWRERTIFEVVRKSEEVQSFLAYHSVVSTEPGVMFVSGFAVAPEQYLVPFTSPHYQNIVAEAGNTYITGGDRGLYTKIYRAV